MSSEEDEFDRMHQDPENWKWGVFYFNPKDSRTIVPKRNPLFGLTLNFASPYTGLVLVGSVAVLVLLTGLFGYLFG